MEQLRISLDVVYVMYAISKDWTQELGARKGINQSHCALGDVTDLILCLTVKVEQAGSGGPFRSSLVFDTFFECVSRAFECFKDTLSNYLTKDNC